MFASHPHFPNMNKYFLTTEMKGAEQGFKGQDRSLYKGSFLQFLGLEWGRSHSPGSARPNMLSLWFVAGHLPRLGGGPFGVSPLFLKKAWSHACWSVGGKAGIEGASLLGGFLLASLPTLPQASACLLCPLVSPVHLFHISTALQDWLWATSKVWDGWWRRRAARFSLGIAGGSSVMVGSDCLSAHLGGCANRLWLRSHFHPGPPPHSTSVGCFKKNKIYGSGSKSCFLHRC